MIKDKIYKIISRIFYYLERALFEAIFTFHAIVIEHLLSSRDGICNNDNLSEIIWVIETLKFEDI